MNTSIIFEREPHEYIWLLNRKIIFTELSIAGYQW